ncbi:hypothetical protein V1525DRAFT_420216 [Lipomyces kononenkoae]|uniref:Uncharacterized protein n=1 Tax=Lipomyces kononenkoae TaxID=34357 RepID=A0ACC3SZN6_LIPKO
MSDNYPYFVPPPGGYTQPEVIGSGSEYGGTGKSLPEFSMEEMLGDPLHQELHDQMKQNDAGLQGGAWNATGSAVRLHPFNSYPEQAETELSEDTAMFNAPPATSRPESRESDTGEDMKSNLNDDDMLSKRKAQNRAAQRAFRERREKYVKELQDKLAIAEKTMKDMEFENARLKREFDWYKAENKVLRESAESARASGGVATSGYASKAIFPEYRDSNEEIRQAHPTADMTFLNPCQIWDRLNEHPRVDTLDINDIMKRLTSKAVCSGDGPIYKTTDVDEAITAQALGLNA